MAFGEYSGSSLTSAKLWVQVLPSEWRKTRWPSGAPQDLQVLTNPPYCVVLVCKGIVGMMILYFGVVLIVIVDNL